MNKTYRVSLTETQTAQLQNITKTQSLSTKIFIHSKILLLAAQGIIDSTIALVVECSISTIERIRKKFTLDGLDAIVQPKRKKGRPPKLDGAAQELLVKMIQETPPTGYARWTGKLIQRRLIELGIVSAISLSTIYRFLRSRKIKLWQKKKWCISKVDAAFVNKATKVIKTYHLPYDKKRPVICFDEKSYELKGDVKKALPAQPGKPKREDYEWTRHGTVNIFLFCEPKTGWRFVKVTKRRTKKDFARCMKQLVDTLYPEADKITVVLDNLNTHTEQAITDTYGKKEGTRIVSKIEFVKTPIHASWLNMAEIELSALSSQSLARRIPTKKMLNVEIKAWNKARNKEKTPINWTYTVEELYSLFEKIRAKQSSTSTQQN